MFWPRINQPGTVSAAYCGIGESVIVNTVPFSHSLTYRGFEERGFHIAVAFDSDPEKTGRVFAGRRVYPITELETVSAEYGITIAILATDRTGSQEMVNRLGKAGVRAILNFVPKILTPPEGVIVEDVDIAAKLETLSFKCRDTEK